MRHHKFDLTGSSGDGERYECYACRCGLSRIDRQNNSAQLVEREYHDQDGAECYAGALPACKGSAEAST